MSCNKEKQTKLWHTVFYENEMKLKQLYVKICCNLPSHGCHVYRVKQLLNERNANKTVVPLLLTATDQSATRTDSALEMFCRVIRCKNLYYLFTYNAMR